MSVWIERPSENGRRELWSVGLEPMILVFVLGLTLTLYTPRALLGSLVVVQDGLIIGASD